MAELPMQPEEFAADLVAGVGANEAEADDLIRRFSKGWSLERMPFVVGANGLKLRHGASGALVEHFAFRCQRVASGRAIKQTCANLRFEPRDRFADRRPTSCRCGDGARPQDHTASHGLGDHNPENASSVAGTLHRGWINLKTAIGGRGRHAILAECERGEAYFKIYRQFKMYNDPSLNPALYGERKGG